MLERQFGEIRIGVNEEFGASLHGAFSEMNPLWFGNWIGPAKIVVPRVSTDIPKNGTAMAFPCFSGAPNVIDEFVIVKCEIRRDVPVPPR